MRKMETRMGKKEENESKRGYSEEMKPKKKGEKETKTTLSEGG